MNHGKIHNKIRQIISVMMVAVIIMLTGCSGDTKGDGSVDLEKKQYGFVVMNQDGEVVSNAQVIFGDLQGTTGSDGTIKFEKSDEIESVSLQVTHDDYYTYSVSDYCVSSSSDIIILRSKSLAAHHLKSAMYSNTDAPLSGEIDLTKEHKKVNMSTENLDFDIVAEVLADSELVSLYELHQKVDNEDTVIAKSTDGHFRNLKVSDFSVGTNVYVTVYDKQNRSISTSLNLEIGENPNYTQYSEISLGDGVSFTVRDDIPVFGGTEFKLSIPSMPIEYKESADMVHIGFNVDEDTFDDDAQFEEYKELVSELNNVKDLKKNYKNLMESLNSKQKKKNVMDMSGFDSGIDVSCGGYAEAGFDSYGNISKGEGYLFITVTGNAEFNWQTVVWIVPVVIGIEGEIEAQLSSSISYSFDENKFDGDVALTIKPGLTAKAGVGFDFFSGGVYGGLELETKLIIASLTEKPGFSYLDLTSTLGVYAKIAFFEAENALLKGTFNLWTRGDDVEEASSGTDEANVNNSVYEYIYDLSNYSPVVEEENMDTTTKYLSSGVVLADGISSGSQPVMASKDDTALMVYTSQVDLDDADSTYSKLYYSYYKDGVWSYRTMLDEDIANEMNPKLYTDGKDYYLMCQYSDFDCSILDNYSEKTDEEKAELMKQVFLSFDMCVWKFNENTGEFESLGCIKTDNIYDYNGSMAVIDDNLYVYSAANAEGDYFGTESQTKNSIYCSVYSDSQWNVNCIESQLGAVRYLSCGKYNDVNTCLYSVDTDYNMETVDDEVLCLNDGSNHNIREGKVSQIMYDNLPGCSENSFIVADDKGLYCLTEDGNIQTVLLDSTNYSEQYAISEKAIYDIKKVENGTEIYAYYLLPDGNYSQPVQITYEDKWQNNISACTINNQDMVTALSEQYGDNIYTQLVTYNVDDYYDLEIEDVYVDCKDTVVTGQIPLEITVANKGNQYITGETVNITDSKGKSLLVEENNYSTDLQPGESYTMNVNVLVEDVSKFGKWNVCADICDNTDLEADENTGTSVQIDISEKDMINNNLEINTGFSDFTVSADVKDAGAYPFLMVEVENDGNCEDSTQLVLLDANEPSNELASYNINNLSPDEKKVYKINIQDSWLDDNGKTAIIVKALDGDVEMYTHNNYVYEYATLNYGKYTISYELNGGENNKDNPVEYTTADKVEFKDPVKEGYKFAGWYTQADFDIVSKVTSLQSGSAGDITVYAKWEEITYLLGDCNKDDKVNLKDAVLSLKIALGIEKSYDINVADVNNDNKVNLTDAQLTLKAALGIVTLK